MEGHDYQKLSIDEVPEHSLEVKDASLDHDTVIRIQAHNLMEAGYLEYEAAAYGVAYLKENVVCYYVCENEMVMEKFLSDCLEKNYFTTPVKYYYKRFDLLTESPEQINQKFRYEVAKRLQNEFPRSFFDAIQDLTVNKIENRAFPIMKELAFQLDSCFNPYQLEIYNGMVDMLLRARQLTIEGYQILKDWLEKEYDKFIDDIRVGRYKKQYTGFAYVNQEDKLKYFCDACSYMAKEKQVQMISKGFIVTPILSKKYYQEFYAGFDSNRKDFENNLKIYLDSSCINLMRLVKSLPSPIEHEKYVHYVKRMQKEGKKEALNALYYYGALWNM